MRFLYPIFALWGVGLFILAASLQPASASVIGIDYGTDWFKVSIVKPGIPLDIVLNAESKRKTPAIVLVRDGDRRYGSDAVSLATRFPQDTYGSLKNLLGKLYDDPIAEEYRKTFTNSMIKDAKRGTVAFQYDDKTVYTVEELVAMQLAQAKHQAEIAGGEAVTGAVITVPPYWGHFERRALLDAAELAGLRVLMLMNDETAVALNYASGRSFPHPQYHIFYDMGAGGTVAALVKFQSVEPKKGVRNVTELQVKATGYDPSLGGHSVDVKLQQHLAEQFAKKAGDKLKGDVFQDSRAMAKLLKEANRVKQVLSANQETISSVEGLMEELDFRVLVTRSTLEDISKDVKSRVQDPVKSVLAQANLTVADIDSLVLVGGGGRIPFIQAALIDLVGEEKIAKNVNADEAAVMGAGLEAATLSRQFRVKEIRIKDINILPIEVAYDAEPKENAANRTFRTTLFSDKTVLGAKKLMNFKRKTDFDYELAYKTGNKPVILRAHVGDVSDAVDKFKNRALGDPKVKSLIELTESGLVSVGEATAQFEVEQTDKDVKDGPSLRDTVMNFFKGRKDDGSAENAEEGEEEQKPEEAKADSPDAEADTANNTVPAVKITIETVKLPITIDWETIKPIDEEYKAEAKKKLAALDLADAEKRAREEARNSLEAFVYSSKEFLYDDEVELTTTEDERISFKEKLDEMSDWLYEGADVAPTEDLKSRLKVLMDIHDPLFFKRSEYRKRGEAVTGFQAAISAAKSILKSFRNLTADDEGRFTENELTTFESLITAAEEWLGTKQAEQAKLAPHEHPILLSKDLSTKAQEITKEMSKLLAKPKKRKPSPKASTSTSRTTPTSTPTGAAEEDQNTTGSEEHAEEEATQKEQPEGQTETGGHDEL
ncbi:hypothetical protein SpCBS45565_g03451 [Spizellomyces sp. 'palustris']|nr:hypothetical protein SpCBS45565_g03451 [Spizellomyces sp. 'palustris']